ncbi:expressed protein [Echinococcus multilocularis]|uniref:Expressed protein n=1 Tax=Echinococcus multilocularis TaxID=6211 RepID=A0A087W065_ECHMU|nr:expressed protein [Echinococcus multilocularis]
MEMTKPEMGAGDRECVLSASNRATEALSDYIQRALSVNADRISHLNDLNTAAYNKYMKIAEATKSFKEKMIPVNEQCLVLAKHLEMLDKILESVSDMEKRVVQLDNLVTGLEEKYKRPHGSKPDCD